MLSVKFTPRLGRPKDIAKRDDIVASATQLFLEKGYTSTSMDSVAKDAGVSKLTIYSHFKDKQALFRACVQTRCDKLGMPDSFMDLAQLPVEKALLQISRDALSRILQHDTIRLLRVLYAEALHNPEVSRIYFEVGPSRVKKAFEELLSEFNRQGQLSIDNASYVSDQFFCLLKGEILARVLMLHAPLPKPDEVERHIRATLSFFLSAYRPVSSVSNKMEKI